MECTRLSVVRSLVGVIVGMAALACGAGSPLPDYPAEPAPAGPAQMDPSWFQLAIYLPTADAAPLKTRWEQWIATEQPGLPVRRGAPESLDPGVTLDTPPIADYPPPPAEVLTLFGRGFEPAGFAAVTASPAVMVTTWMSPASTAPALLRAVSAETEVLARESGGWIWDEQTRELFTPDAFHEMRVDGWEGDQPLIPSHVVIHLYDDGGYDRAVTLGLGKFGVPDLVVEGVLPNQRGAIDAVLNAVAQGLVSGIPVGEDGWIEVELDRLPGFLEDATAARESGGTGRIRLQLRVAEPEEGDAPNRLWELTFGEADPSERYVAQARFLTALFGGTPDDVVNVEHDPTIEAASARARADLAAMAAGFDALPGGSLTVKAPFDTTAGGREYMWLTVTKWEGASLTGVLGNEPDDVPGLSLGSTVTVRLDEVFDYLLTAPDGTVSGGAANRLIEQRMGER